MPYLRKQFEWANLLFSRDFNAHDEYFKRKTCVKRSLTQVQNNEAVFILKLVLSQGVLRKKTRMLRERGLKVGICLIELRFAVLTANNDSTPFCQRCPQYP